MKPKKANSLKLAFLLIFADKKLFKMNKIKTLSIAAIMLLSASTFTSCKKEVSGCTDLDATNFNSSATLNNGSCTYQGSAVIWFGQQMAQTFVNAGVTSVTYYIDGNVAGSSATNIYFPSAPNCGAASAATVDYNMAGTKVLPRTLVIKNQNGVQVGTGTIDFEANKCVSFELF
jgi:hypothetical protein